MEYSETRLQFFGLPLFGRDKELQVLQDAIERLRDENEQAADNNNTNTRNSQHPNRKRPRRAIEICMLHGGSGTGKSAIVKELLRRQELAHPKEFEFGNYHTYVCSGKFSQMAGAAEPYSALKQAFGELCDSILSTTDNEKLLHDLKQAVGGEGGKILTNVVPMMESIIGKQPPLKDTQGSQESLNRLKYLFKGFVKAVCQHRRLVIFLDDLQWSDDSTLALIESILGDVELSNLMFIGAYRDNSEDLPTTHGLLKLLSALQTHYNRKVYKIPVLPLDVGGVNDLIQHITGLKDDGDENDKAQQQQPQQQPPSSSPTFPLAEIVHRKTHGNAFCVLQFLQLLEMQRYLKYEFRVTKFQWTFDLNQIESQTNIAEQVVEVVAGRLRNLPPKAQLCLKVAACLWSTFDAASLWQIMQHLKEDTMDKDAAPSSSSAPRIATLEELIELLDVPVREGLLDVFEKSKITYKFSHDRIQQSSYSLIPEGKEREMFHLQIGQILFSQLRTSNSGDKNNDDKTWMVCLAADQLNRGSASLETKEEQISLAELNLQAAKMAISLSAFVPAWGYLTSGIDLLNMKASRNDKWVRHYDLAMSLHQHASEMASCLGKYPECDKISQEAYDHAKSLDDKTPIYLSQIKALGQQEQFEKSMSMTVDVLEQLEEPMPKKANMGQVLWCLRKTMKKMKKLTDDDIMNLPPVTDMRKAIAMKLLSTYSVHALLQQRTADMLLCLLHNVLLTLKYGLYRISPSSVGAYGLVLASMGNMDEGYRLGKLSVKLLERLGAKEWQANLTQIFTLYTRHWRERYLDCMDAMTEAYKVGMAYGDVEFAFYNAICAVSMYYLAGLQLEAAEKDARCYCEQMLEYNRDNNWSVSAPTWQLLLNLMGDAESVNLLKLTGKAMNEDAFLAKNLATKNMGALQTFWINKGQLSYYYGDYEEAKRVLKEFGKTKANLATHFFCIIYTVFSGMNYCALARKSPKKRKKYRSTARKFANIIKAWVKGGNMNLVHKLLLLNAELEGLKTPNGRIQIHSQELRKVYDTAIAASSRAGFVQDAALANERAGICFLELGDEFWAGTYLTRARALYLDWGALGKANAMIRDHPRFLSDEKVDQATKTSDDISASSSAFHSAPSESRGTNLRGVQNFDPSLSKRHSSVVFSQPLYADSGSFRFGSQQGADGDSSTLGTSNGRVQTVNPKRGNATSQRSISSGVSQATADDSGYFQFGGQEKAGDGSSSLLLGSEQFNN